MTELREARRVEFATKNARRKLGRKNGTRAQQIEARRLRRAQLPVKGAFGSARRDDYFDMAYGTTGGES